MKILPSIPILFSHKRVDKIERKQIAIENIIQRKEQELKTNSLLHCERDSFKITRENPTNKTYIYLKNNIEMR